MTSSSEEPAPTLVYTVLGVVGLYLLSRLPLVAIFLGLLRLAVGLVRPALMIFGVVHLWGRLAPEPREDFPEDLAPPGEEENVARLVERGRQMGF